MLRSVKGNPHAVLMMKDTVLEFCESVMQDATV
jgi:hypothetical protein